MAKFLDPRRWWPVLGLCLMPLLARTAAADPNEVRERWGRMSPEQRDQVRESYRRWQAMSDLDRDVLRRRHENFQRLREKVHETMEDEDRGRFRDMTPEQRRVAMDQNTRDFLRRVKDSLPEGLRNRLYENMHGVAPWDRSRELSRIIHEEISKRVPRFVRSMVQRGNINEREAQQFQTRLADADPRERFRTLRYLLLKDPEGFGVPPDLRERWRDCEDPHRAMRMMCDMRPRRMPLEQKLQMLADQGVAAEQLDALRDLPAEQADAATDELFREHGLSPPNHLQRWLLSKGVPKDEVEAVFAGDRGSVPERLRELMDRHGLDRGRGPDRDEFDPGDRDRRERWWKRDGGERRRLEEPRDPDAGAAPERSADDDDGSGDFDRPLRRELRRL